MHKKLLGLFFLLMLSCCTSTRDFHQPNPPGEYGYLPMDLPKNLTEEVLKDQAKDQVKQIWGFTGRDYRVNTLDSLSRPFMALQSFDQETRWPKKHLPDGFDPVEWLNAGKNPGLGIRQLNRAGITGRGISIALFDMPMRSTHSELAGRITYKEVFNKVDRTMQWHFHGLACSSILAGKTIGVAPGVHLYYFAVPDDGNHFLNYSIAVEQLLILNGTLKPEDKIRMISISDGHIGPHQKEWDAAKTKLKAECIEVLHAGPDIIGFGWGGCPPFLDREKPEFYEMCSYLKGKKIPKSAVIIPADYRTTASNAGDKNYVYWGAKGGVSYAIPYVVGLAALAWQVNPQLKFSEIKELLIKTAAKTSDGYKVLMPLEFINAVKSQSLHSQVDGNTIKSQRE